MIKKKQVTIFILILGVILIILGIFFQFAFVESNNQRYVEKECSKQADSDNEDYEEKYITKIKINKSDKNAISFTNYELLQFNKKIDMKNILEVLKWKEQPLLIMMKKFKF